MNALHSPNFFSPADSYLAVNSRNVSFQSNSSRENGSGEDYYSLVGASVNMASEDDRASRKSRKETAFTGCSYDRGIHSSDYSMLDPEYSNPECSTAMNNPEYFTTMDNPEYYTAINNPEYFNPSHESQDGAYSELAEESYSQVIFIRNTRIVLPSIS